MLNFMQDTNSERLQYNEVNNTHVQWFPFYHKNIKHAADSINVGPLLCSKWTDAHTEKINHKSVNNLYHELRNMLLI